MATSTLPGVNGLYWVAKTRNVTNRLGAVGSTGGCPGTVEGGVVGVAGGGGGEFDFSVPACFPAVEPDPEAGVSAVPDGNGVGGGLAAAAALAAAAWRAASAATRSASSALNRSSRAFWAAAT